MLFHTVLLALFSLRFPLTRCAYTCTTKPGLEMAVFSTSNPYDIRLVKNTTAFAGQASLLWNGTSTSVGGRHWGFECDGNFSMNGSPEVIPCKFNTIMWRGYLYTQYWGVYTFVFPEIDDIAYFWIWDTARKGWNSTNALMETRVWSRWPSQQVIPAGQNATFLQLQPYYHIPIRILMGQSTYTDAYKFHIIDPMGNTILSVGTGPGGPIFTTTCNGFAPPMPYDWGNEPL